LTQADYRKTVEPRGFAGTTIVGTELATLRLPANTWGCCSPTVSAG